MTTTTMKVVDWRNNGGGSGGEGGKRRYIKIIGLRYYMLLKAEGLTAK